MSPGLSHIDFSIADPTRSIPFYDALLSHLGFVRWRAPGDDWQEPDPSRAAWGFRNADGTTFGIDLRPATTNTARRYDRFEPGPHHMAFAAPSDAAIDDLYSAMLEVDADVADPPANYGGQPGYGDHYYAVFFYDPDGFKVEVVHSRGLEV